MISLRKIFICRLVLILVSFSANFATEPVTANEYNINSVINLIEIK
jgi:hypothetical protein